MSDVWWWWWWVLWENCNCVIQGLQGVTQLISHTETKVSRAQMKGVGLKLFVIFREKLPNQDISLSEDSALETQRYTQVFFFNNTFFVIIYLLFLVFFFFIYIIGTYLLGRYQLEFFFKKLFLTPYLIQYEELHRKEIFIFLPTLRRSRRFSANWSWEIPCWKWPF